MKAIRKIVGWFLVVFAGLLALSGLLCAVFTLLGQMEITGFGARLGYTAAFLAVTAMSLWVVWLGWKLRAAEPKPAPAAPVSKPAPVQKAAIKPATKPAPVKRERTPLPTWVTGPGLCHDRFPYQGFAEWDEGLDECRGGAVCYVYNGDVPLREAIEALVKKEHRGLKGIHVRLPSAKTLEYLDDSTYAQKWEGPDAVPVMDLDCNEKLFDLCREHGIRIVTYEGPHSLFDHVNSCHLRIHEEEGYGSVDDAATIGMWYAEVQPLWLDYPDRRGAAEIGNVGMGERNQHHVGSAEMEITCSATDKVKYYYFPNGLLLLRGVGPTKSVDPGGHDGRTAYLPENPPWSDMVATGTKRLIVSDGVTTVGQGLLSSLKNLEEINLGDSVTHLYDSSCPKVTVLRGGKKLVFCDLFSGDLQELRLPDHIVHIGSNGGALKLRSSDPEIVKIRNGYVGKEYAAVMQELFWNVPDVGRLMGELGALDIQGAAEAIQSLRWHSGYSQRKSLAAKDLREILHMEPPKEPVKRLDITVPWHYGVHGHMVLGAIVYGARCSKAETVNVTADYYFSPKACAAIAQWWRNIMPGVTLILTQKKTGEELVNTTLPQPDVYDVLNRYMEYVSVWQVEPWVQLDYSLRFGYGYEDMLNFLDAAASMADRVDKVWTAELVGAPEQDVTEQFREAGRSALQSETGVISVGLLSIELGPVKLVLMNQTRHLRVFVPGKAADIDRTAVDRFVIELIKRVREKA